MSEPCFGVLFHDLDVLLSGNHLVDFFWRCCSRSDVEFSKVVCARCEFHLPRTRFVGCVQSRDVGISISQIFLAWQTLEPQVPSLISPHASRTRIHSSLLPAWSSDTEEGVEYMMFHPP